jgi:hypothetical protein
LLLIIASLHRRARDTDGLEEKIGQGFDEPLRVERQWAFAGLMFGIENKLSRVAIWTSPHCLSPSLLKEAIVRHVSESRMPPERRQT